MRLQKSYKDLFKVEAKVEGVEKAIDRLREDQRAYIEQTRQDIRDLKKDFDDVRRRLSHLEGALQNVFERSTKEALLHLAREHKEEHGSLEGFLPRQLLGTDEQEDQES